MCGASARMVSIGERLCGWCRGASAMSDFNCCTTGRVIRVGSVNIVPPCTTRWPIPSTASPPNRLMVVCNMTRVADRWSRSFAPHSFSNKVSPLGPVTAILGATPSFSTWPRNRKVWSASSSNTANLMLDEPALTTATCRTIAFSFPPSAMPDLSLDRRGRILAARRDQQLGYRTGCEPDHFLVGTTGQDDRHLRAQYDAGGVGVREEGQALGQHVAGLEVRHD